jgi:hypothetical protein
MRYIYLIFFILVAWLLFDEFIFKDRSSEGLDNYGDKWKDLGKRLHFIFGVLAALVILFLAIRFIIQYFIQA